MLQNSFTEILRLRSGVNDRGITFIEANGQEDFLSYQRLYNQALKSLGYLQHKGLQPRDELVFQIDDNKTFIIIFWACVLGGIVPVPLAIGQNADHKQKLFKIWPSLNNPYLIISPDNLKRLKEFAGQYELKNTYDEINEKMIDLGDIFSVDSGSQIFDAQSNDLLFIQFSSGSTGSPKGVTLTHRNVALNIEAIGKASGYSDRDTMISWMPLTHDMGLIGFHLSPLFHGINHYLLPTSVFIRRPSLWLEKASEHKISILCSPNFGYKYTLKHCLNSKKYNWNLSDVRLLYNGAEPISKELCDQFLGALSGYGLRSQAMCPVYGLAEASLAVSISNPEDEVISANLDRNKLNIGDKIVEYEGSKKSVSFVNVGKPIKNCAIRITDDTDVNLEDCMIGHVQIKGDNVSSGYYNNEQETQKVLTRDGWLKTGDLGFMKDDALYITGRLKDIIFVNGQNYYPHDIEKVAEQVDGIDLNKIAVAGFHNDKTQKDEIVAFVFYRGNIEGFIPAALALKSHINIQMGITLDSIFPVKSIPKTTSGKLQRFKLLERLKRGDFKEVELEMSQLLHKTKWLDIPVESPENDIEARLLKIWKDVLCYDEIGVTHKFFEIGGNSLKAAEIEMLVLKEFQVELSLEKFLQGQTIKALAVEIEALDKQTYKPIKINRKDSYFPLGSSQKRIYYGWELDKLSIAYNNPIAIRLEKKIDLEKFQKCFERLIARHDALRMSFKMLSEPKFKVHDKVNFEIKNLKCDVSELPEKPKSLIQPFDLTKPCLMRAWLLKVGSNIRLLLLDFHHIVSDGVSILNFIKELLGLYQDNVLEDLPVCYRDFVYWEKENQLFDKTKAQKAYWLNHLQDSIPTLEMPLDFPRPAIFNTEGSKVEFIIDHETTQKLKNLASSNSCTLHAVMFTIYNLLLSKYSGQEEIVVGIPVAGRRHPDLQKIMGMFVNNLAIKTEINWEESFIQLLDKESTHLLQALKNQDYPFEELQKATIQKRDVSRNPIFDSMFLFQNMALPEAHNGDVKYSRYFFDPGYSKFDISMEVFENTDGISYYIEYATSLFKKETITRIGRHFLHLIKDVIHKPNDKLCTLSVIDKDEYNQFIRTFNSTNDSYPRDKTIYQLFEEQVKKTPEAIAIEFNGEFYTYEKLNREANQLADVLCQEGSISNKRVGIFLKRSPQLIISTLGILKSGACYVPLDVNFPSERIKNLLTDSQCSLIVTETDKISEITNLQPSDLKIVNIDSLPSHLSQSNVSKNVNSPDDLAYIIYTSGTTGKPKGVMITHKSLVNYVSWAVRQYVKGEPVSFPLFTSIAFDLTVTSVFVPLITGNKLIIYDENDKNFAITKVIRDNKVDIIKLTPSHLKVLTEDKSGMPVNESKIKRLIVGGEAFEMRLANEIYNRFNKSIEIYNEYGPTEATVGCMIHQFEPGQPSVSVPIGIPASNTAIYLLDRYLKPVPAGVKGEIYISGEGLAKGYLTDKALTSQKFINNPFIKGKKMYKTGDMARRLSTEILEYCGRQDDQVQINGYRVELKEIENSLLDHDLVLDAVVAIKKKTKKQQFICAYYRSQKIIEESVLRDYLAKRLPYYMIPVYFVKLETIPLNRNGKVDYDKLPQPEPSKNTSEHILPQNEIEKISIKVWEEILGEEHLSVRDNFFELGGDSIKAVQIASKLAEKGMLVNVKDILTYHTIERISSYIQLTDASNEYEQGIVEGTFGFTPIVSWFFKQEFENPHYYNQSILLKFNEKIDIKLLQRTFQKLIEYHDGLRVNYDADRQVLFYNNILLKKEFVIKEYKIDKHDFALDSLTAICEQIKKRIDITNDLLIKAAIIKENNTNEKLFITIHHLAIDGISWRILLKDLNAIYKNLITETQFQLPPKTASMIDWENTLIEFSNTLALKTEEKYWEDVENMDFKLPLDYETDEWTGKNLDNVSKILDRELTAFLLKEAHQVYKTDVPILLSTALALTLGEWIETSVFILEMENHGRHLDNINVSRTIGWFTVMFPIKLSLEESGMGGQIKSVKEQIRNIPNHGMGYGIYKYLKNHDKPYSSELSEIRFNYLGQFDSELSNELFSYCDEPHGKNINPNNKLTTKLELNSMIIDGRFCLEVNFNKKAHKQETINWLAETFFKNLEDILEHIKNEDDVHFTPSDFDAVDLDEEELNALFS